MPDIRVRPEAEPDMAGAIRQYLEAKENKEQLLRADLRAAWQEYEASGMHLTFDEADQWLVRLEAGEEAPIPVCHP